MHKHRICISVFIVAAFVILALSGCDDYTITNLKAMPNPVYPGSSSTITAVVKDKNGNLAPNIEVKFETNNMKCGNFGNNPNPAITGDGTGNSDLGVAEISFNPSAVTEKCVTTIIAKCEGSSKTIRLTVQVLP
jgi:hypothetical protein